MSLRDDALALARRARDEALHVASALGRPRFRAAALAEGRTLARAAPALVRWLFRTHDGARWTLLRVVLQHAEATPDATAIVTVDGATLSYRALADRSSRFAHALVALGVRRGDVVALLGPSAGDYVALILAATRVGAVAALINPQLRGAQLAHAIAVSKARVCVAHASLVDHARAIATPSIRLSAYAGGDFDALVEAAPSAPFPTADVAVSEDFVLIYTSGTTGLPKPSRVSHARALFAGAGFAHAIFALSDGDVVYVALPLHHSNGLLLGVGSALVAGVPAVVRGSFSARAFWSDARRYDVTAFVYIGEIVRYLLEAPPTPDDRAHRVRVAAGNGLRGDVWSAFQSRFGVAEIREFYAATEAPWALFNVTGIPGAVGRVPLRRLMPLRLARYDVDRDEHVRDAEGHCVECGVNEVGELLVRLRDAPLLEGLSGFRGYADAASTKAKVMTDVFSEGDRWYRSGDLLRFDDDDFFYFVDRIGDTFRFKGENVSTTEVAEVIARAPGVRAVAVVGVKIPGLEGQVGLAAIAGLEPDGLGSLARAIDALPAFARPRFVRLVHALETTSTHKITKAALRSEGVDPARVTDPLFVAIDGAYVPIDAARWDAIVTGRVRL